MARFPLNPGYRITGGYRTGHLALDIAPPVPGNTNTGCFAPERAYVEASGYKSYPEGNYIILRGLQTGKYHYFGHFSTRRVLRGQTIAEGTLIGILGRTGAATGVHTHWEVRSAVGGGTHYNPLEWLAGAQPAPAPAPPAAKQKVFLPSSIQSWNVYDVNTAPFAQNRKGFLSPYKFPPGITYDILEWRDNNSTVVIQTQTYGRVKIWVKGTVAQFR